MSGQFRPTTNKGHGLSECASALQKAIRRGDEDVALYFAVELYQSNFDEYLWKRLRIICSEDIGLAEPLMPSNIHALYVMFTDQKKKKDDDHAPERLFLIHAVLLLCRAQKSRLVDWTLISYFGEHADRDLPLPDYAFDKHNQKGRQMGRGWDHFFEEGTKLNPQANIDGEDAMKLRARKAISDTQGKIPNLNGPKRQANLFDEVDE